MAEIVLYSDGDFGGVHTHLFRSTPDFTQLSVGGADTGIDAGTWNDIVSSFVIISGTWQFFKNVDFNFRQGDDLGPGLYSWVGNYGIDDNALSSIQLVGE